MAFKAIEDVRTAGGVGSSLQAEVVIEAAATTLAELARLGDDLKFVFITSQATANEGTELKVTVVPSTAAKCDRCWHYRHDVGADVNHPGICARCVRNLDGAGETRAFASMFSTQLFCETSISLGPRADLRNCPLKPFLGFQYEVRAYWCLGKTGGMRASAGSLSVVQSTCRFRQDSQPGKGRVRHTNDSVRRRRSQGRGVATKSIPPDLPPSQRRYLLRNNQSAERGQGNRSERESVYRCGIKSQFERTPFAGSGRATGG